MTIRRLLIKVVLYCLLGMLFLFVAFLVLLFLPGGYSRDAALEAAYPRIYKDLAINPNRVRYIGGLISRESEIVFELQATPELFAGFRQITDVVQRKEFLCSCQETFAACNVDFQFTSDVEFFVRHMNTYTLILMSKPPKTYLLYLGAQ